MQFWCRVVKVILWYVSWGVVHGDAAIFTLRVRITKINPGQGGD